MVRSMIVPDCLQFYILSMFPLSPSRHGDEQHEFDMHIAKIQWTVNSLLKRKAYSGGHAGCEASNASAKMGLKTALVTANIKNIADMPCNPSIGGTAKGIVVREIDAMGGLMGKVADKTHIQIKMLNNAKGPAVRSLRAQADKITYPKEMLKELQALDNLTIIEGMVENLIVENNTIEGIILENGTEIYCKACNSFNISFG